VKNETTPRQNPTHSEKERKIDFLPKKKKKVDEIPRYSTREGACRRRRAGKRPHEHYDTSTEWADWQKDRRENGPKENHPNSKSQGEMETRKKKVSKKKEERAGNGSKRRNSGNITGRFSLGKEEKKKKRGRER